ncbi:MAG: hypothetical protein RLZZ481_2907, partial [Pseudomonadota bacterium]
MTLHARGCMNILTPSIRVLPISSPASLIPQEDSSVITLMEVC